MTLPLGWTIASVGEVAELNPKTEVADATPVGFVPMQALGTGFRSKLSFESRPWGDVKKAYTHFADGDVLLAKITPCFENGKAGLAQGLPNRLGAGSSEFFVCRPRPSAIDPRYLLAWVSGDDFRARATVQMTGSVGHKRVPKDFLLSEVLPLAPYAEQHRIADKLDSVLARVDACRDRLACVAPLLKRFRQSVLAAATSGRLTEEWRERSGLPSPQAVQLGDVIRVSSGKFLPAKDMAAGGTVPVYGGNGVNGYHDVGNVQDTTVVIGRVGFYCGSVHLTPRVAWVTDNALVVKHSTTTASVRFLFYALRAIDLRTNDSSTAQPVISGQKIYSLPMLLPHLVEQAEIVRRVETLFAFADRLEARLAQAQTAVDRLTPSLLAKAFRGELVPQDPADEPAAELLQRLSAQRAASPTKPHRRRAAASA